MTLDMFISVHDNNNSFCFVSQNTVSLLDYINANLANIQPGNLQNAQKGFLQKAPGVNGLI